MNVLLRLLTTKAFELTPISQDTIAGDGDTGLLSSARIPIHIAKNEQDVRRQLTTPAFLRLARSIVALLENYRLGLFLVRENGTFSPTDVKRAELIFPALDGYHHAHLSWLFNGLRYTNRAEMEGFIKRPTLIQDRFQERVYSNESWNEAVSTDPTIDEIVHAASTDNAAQKYDLNDFILRSEALDRYFPLAPGGRIFVLEPRFFCEGQT